MAILSFEHPWAFVFGLLGNIISSMVYLAPVPTFRRICRKKSTEGFQSFPYVVALFSAMQLIYYAVIKTNAYFIITVNTAGCIIELTYLTIYLIYAPRSARLQTIKWMVLLNVILFSIILGVSLIFFHGADRVKVVGWFNMTFSVSVFAAPLSIIRLVIRTKSVEFMPFFLSFFLTLSAIAWFFYGLLTKDIYVATPNILGFTFGVIQMILYISYKDFKKGKQDEKLSDQVLTDFAKPSPVGIDASKIENSEEGKVSERAREEANNDKKRTQDANEVMMNQV